MPKTWDDLREETVNCPYLRRCYMLAESGAGTREEALLATVFALSKVRRELSAELVSARQREARPIIRARDLRIEDASAALAAWRGSRSRG